MKVKWNTKMGIVHNQTTKHHLPDFHRLRVISPVNFLSDTIHGSTVSSRGAHFDGFGDTLHVIVRRNYSMNKELVCSMNNWLVVSLRLNLSYARQLGSSFQIKMLKQSLINKYKLSLCIPLNPFISPTSLHCSFVRQPFVLECQRL